MFVINYYPSGRAPAQFIVRKTDPKKEALDKLKDVRPKVRTV